MKTPSEKEKEIRIKRQRELEEHDARIARLMYELHGYALRHGYSDEDLYDAAYAFTVETLSLMSKRDAREILRKLEEGGDGMREVLKKASKKHVWLFEHTRRK